MSNTTTTEPPPTLLAKARGFHWLGRGWDWFTEDPGVYLLMGLVLVIVLAISQGILLGPISVVLAAVGLRRAEGRLPEEEQLGWMDRIQGDFAKGLSYFIPALLSGIIVLCFSLIGLIFLIVPGLVIFSMYLFTFHFIVDRNEDFWTAMESSRQLVSRDYFGYSLFTLMLLVINLLGVFFFGVGAIFTLMVTGLAVTVAYRDNQGLDEVIPEEVAPPAPPVVIE